MLKVAIIGPESTGKTALTLLLAKHFNAPYELEYAREYVENLNRRYCFEDLVAISQKQIEQEQKYTEGISNASFVFFDTDLIITKVWFEYCFSQVPDFLEKHLQTGFFDLYLLCKPDLPWEDDPVREHGDGRDFFFEWYKREIIALGKPYEIIEGLGESRFENALSALSRIKK